MTFRKVIIVPMDGLFAIPSILKAIRKLSVDNTTQNCININCVTK